MLELGNFVSKMGRQCTTTSSVAQAVLHTLLYTPASQVFYGGDVGDKASRVDGGPNAAGKTAEHKAICQYSHNIPPSTPENYLRLLRLQEQAA